MSTNQFWNKTSNGDRIVDLLHSNSWISGRQVATSGRDNRLGHKSALSAEARRTHRGMLVPNGVLAEGKWIKTGERGTPLCPKQIRVAMPWALFTRSFLLLVVRPGAPSSVLAPSSDALCS